MKMKELSSRTEIPERTIRYYISAGVFIPEKYTENYDGRRNYDFTDNDIKHLQQITLLRKYNFSIKDIKSFLSGNTNLIPALSKHIDGEKESVSTQLQGISVMENALRSQPENLDELCRILTTPYTSQAPVPSIDQQSGYKPMFEKAKRTIFYITMALVASAVVIFVVLPLLFAVIYNGVDNVYREHYNQSITDTARYEEVIGNPLICRFGNTPVCMTFPKSIEDKNVIDFFSNSFEEEIQITLDIQYDEQSFEAELDRLSHIDGSKTRYDEWNFQKPAYVAVYGDGACFEYALIDYENLQISYVYLQIVSDEHALIDKKYLPNNYDEVYSSASNKKDGEAFNIYRDYNSNSLELRPESHFSDFRIENGKVYFDCVLVIENNTTAELSFSIFGDFSEDAEAGLVTPTTLDGCHQEDYSNKIFTVNPSDTAIYKVCFIGDWAGKTEQKQNRLLPDISFQFEQFKEVN